MFEVTSLPMYETVKACIKTYSPIDVVVYHHKKCMQVHVRQIYEGVNTNYKRACIQSVLKSVHVNFDF